MLCTYFLYICYDFPLVISPFCVSFKSYQCRMMNLKENDSRSFMFRKFYYAAQQKQNVSFLFRRNVTNNSYIVDVVFMCSGWGSERKRRDRATQRVFYGANSHKHPEMWKTDMARKSSLCASDDLFTTCFRNIISRKEKLNYKINLLLPRELYAPLSRSLLRYKRRRYGKIAWLRSYLHA